ncbi:MotA/TolQ/ExbB proton channel family protein [Myxosarcina sp. GI1]|uniref:MotA/TolQ/ExbB proton channel family protein n=1 Tax=Myxosarcina sp. GI1 TaxID=1541065 RepID=UPI000567591A|nr:MotA/TolQ/ExbB proton channel family protein [Myxosarcina sp. GI1]
MNKLSSKSKSRVRGSKRQELEINLPFVLGVAAAIFVVVYAILLLFRDTYLGILFYERGFTQYVAVALAAIVAAITILKYIKLRYEYRALNRIWIADHIPLNQPESHEVKYFQERLTKDGNLVAMRCSRILKAYIQSGDRAVANEFALDDSSFYLSASESSYSIPRILVWAIPLLGFIGTVIGISQAVNGFSGFLEQAGDVEQIKEGIGTVTGGLAVAFDTTLLALFLSVVVMIPLVLVERYESRLLLGIDVFINDKLLPRLRDKNKHLDEAAVDRAVKDAIDGHFPNPEALVEPAQLYAQQAAQALAQGFMAEISKVQDVNSQVMDRVTQIRELATQDRQEFMTFFTQQQQASQELIYQIKTTVDEIRSKNVATANDLSDRTQEISNQLENAAKALEHRVAALEQASSKFSDFKNLQSSLDDSLRSLEKTAQLETVLVGVRDNLGKLEPILQQLNKPRRITLVEQDGNNK